MRKITEQELKEILEKHEKWLCSKEGGERADLSYANLYKANLYNANLSNADLECANLSYANLYNANLYNANLYKANLYNANLSYANLYKANLSNADLECANLSYANLYNANLYNADLECADLECADLECADLECADLDKSEQCRLGIILQKPRMGYKKCGKNIVQLLIPKGAIVFSINNKECRTNKATPIAILDLEGKITNRKKIVNDYNEDFEYKLMQEIEIQDFNLMYNVEHASGIHFFWEFENAKEY